jgi:YfiH family protein
VSARQADTPAILTPAWPAPPGVRVAFTLRAGGASEAPYASLNLGSHVGDSQNCVAENRRRVAGALGLPSQPAWLEQAHGTRVADLDAPGEERRADASFTRCPGRVCVVQVADCMPVLFAARDAGAVAAAHAGWRGLVAGVLEATVRALAVPARELVAWLGPAIGSAHFEVGAEVREAFLAHDARAAAAFSANARGRWQCDLVALATARLHALGVPTVSGGEYCTYADAQRFFSYRRDGRTGRSAALIWME